MKGIPVCYYHTMITVLWLDPPEWPIIIGLRVTYDVPNMGDGNCFYSAVLQQMKNRDDIKDYFRQSHKYFSNCHELRLSVVNFVLLHCTINNEYIQGYKSLYEASIHLENQNMNWLQFLHNQEKDGVYATKLCVKATAVFLGIKIHVTSERYTLSNPFNVWSRFWDHHDGANNCLNGKSVCYLAILTMSTFNLSFIIMKKILLWILQWKSELMQVS